MDCWGDIKNSVFFDQIYFLSRLSVTLSFNNTIPISKQPRINSRNNTSINEASIERHALNASISVLGLRRYSSKEKAHISELQWNHHSWYIYYLPFAFVASVVVVAAH